MTLVLLAACAELPEEATRVATCDEDDLWTVAMDRLPALYHHLYAPLMAHAELVGLAGHASAETGCPVRTDLGDGSVLYAGPCDDFSGALWVVTSTDPLGERVEWQAADVDWDLGEGRARLDGSVLRTGDGGVVLAVDLVAPSLGGGETAWDAWIDPDAWERDDGSLGAVWSGEGRVFTADVPGLPPGRACFTSTLTPVEGGGIEGELRVVGTGVAQARFDGASACAPVTIDGDEPGVELCL